MATLTAAARPAVPVAAPPRTRRPGLWALGGWLGALPIAFALPCVAGLDPFDLRAAFVPLGIGIALLAGVAALCRRRAAPHLVCAAAGLYAGWVALTLRTALNGTPYGFGGLSGEALRLTAMATRFSATAHSADGIVGTVPSAYPPLYPWLVGRASAVSGISAWQLMGPAAAIALSGAVVAAFLLWRRLVPDLMALAIAVAALAVDARPEKAHAVAALLVAVPWILATFAGPPRGRLHWLPAGLIGGLLVLTCQSCLMFGAPGILVLIVRGREWRHAALTCAMAAVTASWFLLPYLWWGVVHGLELTGTFQSSRPLDSPFTEMTPAAVVELAGLALLLRYRGREWWATPLLLLAVSCYGYRLVAMIGFPIGEVQDASRMAGSVLVAAGLLAMARTASALRLPTGVGRSAAVALVAWAAVTGWQAWMPGEPHGGGHSQRLVSQHHTAATRAFAQPLADGSHQDRALPRGLPVTLIQHAVRVVRGPAAPSVLSYSEALFAYLPWNGYLPTATSRTGGPVHWFSRYRFLRRLSTVTDPAEFARLSEPIDVFVLRRESAQTWTWRPRNRPSLTFHPAQFASGRFEIFQLPDATALAIRNSPVVAAPSAAYYSDDRE